MLVSILAVLLVGLFLAWLARRSPFPPADLKQRRLTANPANMPLTGVGISRDGKHLAYSERSGISLRLLRTGETRRLAQQTAGITFVAVARFPEDTKVMALAEQPGQGRSLYLAVLGGTVESNA